MRRVFSITLSLALCVGPALGQALEQGANPGVASLDYSGSISAGWVALGEKDLDTAVMHYRRATRLSPKSEDAWLGVQLAYMLAQQWSAAAEAGEVALRLNPESYYARSRQAWVRFNQGRYPEARNLYAGLVSDMPDDAEMRLGLGYSELRLGEFEKARQHCLRAAQYVGMDDPRVAECLDARAPEEGSFDAALIVSYLSYRNPEAFDDVRSVMLSVGGKFASGLTLWGGLGYSETVLSYDVDDYWQVNPTVGVGYLGRHWVARFAASLVLSNEPVIDGTPVLTATFGWRNAQLAVDASVTGSVYDLENVLQATARVRYSPARWVTLWAGPDLTTTDLDGEATLFSFEGGVAFRPAERLTLELKGYGGKRRHFVEFEGLSVWAGADRFTGGYSAALRWRMFDAMSLNIEFEHEFGDEQFGTSRSFEIIGGTLGVQLHL